MTASRIVVLALLSVALMVPVPASAQESCRGQAATIVGVQGEPITGTDGDDVIVTNGASSADAGAGNDLICVSAGDDITIDAGDGDDIVDATAATGQTETTLGAGADTYDGGGQADRVYGGTAGTWDDAPVDEDRDTIETAAGGDWVDSGQAGTVNADDIDLGTGYGKVVLRGGHTTGRIAATGTTNKPVVDLAIDEPGHWVVDAPAAELRTGGATTARWSHAFRIEEASGGRDTWVRYLGLQSWDRVSIQARVAGVVLRGGDDTLRLSPVRPTTGRLHGGAGDDSIWVNRASGPVRLDLATGRISTSHRGPGARLDGFEDTDLSGYDLSVRGSDHADHVTFEGCRVVVKGGRGDDTLEDVSLAGFDWCSLRPAGAGRSLRTFGGPGDDLLMGSRYRDHLDGGPGHDTAYGEGGIDWCRAEVRSSCRRP